MKRRIGMALAIASLTTTIHAAGFAAGVVNYTPGSGIPQGYDNPAAALGEPSRITPGQFGGPVDPFSPPYLPEQVVSIGTGGSLTLDLGVSVANDPNHAFGLDFIIFGNSGFQIVNGDFTGGGITDGSMLGANEGSTRVAVSLDGNTFYELTPSLTPVVDGLFPTDGSGNFFRPVNPSLTSSDFAGKNLAGIRELYDGSGGGRGFDIGWARNAAGETAALDGIRYVRIDVLSGVSEIDAISVVPEPGPAWLLVTGIAILYFRRRQV